jgi:hypothetical protein
LQVGIRPVTFKPDGSAVHSHAASGGYNYVHVYTSVAADCPDALDRKMAWHAMA